MQACILVLYRNQKYLGDVSCLLLLALLVFLFCLLDSDDRVEDLSEPFLRLDGIGDFVSEGSSVSDFLLFLSEIRAFPFDATGVGLLRTMKMF